MSGLGLSNSRKFMLDVAILKLIFFSLHEIYQKLNKVFSSLSCKVHRKENNCWYIEMGFGVIYTVDKEKFTFLLLQIQGNPEKALQMHKNTKGAEPINLSKAHSGHIAAVRKPGLRFDFLNAAQLQRQFLHSSHQNNSAVRSRLFLLKLFTIFSTPSCYRN